MIFKCYFLNSSQHLILLASEPIEFRKNNEKSPQT